MVGNLADTRARGEKKLVDYSRGLVPVLRDAGREHSAKQLEELLFVIDAEEQEKEKYIRTHGFPVISHLLRQVKR